MTAGNGRLLRHRTSMFVASTRVEGCVANLSPDFTSEKTEITRLSLRPPDPRRASPKAPARPRIHPAGGCSPNGLDTGNVWNWEDGRNEPELRDNVRNLAHILGAPEHVRS